MKQFPCTFNNLSMKHLLRPCQNKKKIRFKSFCLLQDNFDSVELLKLTRLVRLARVFQKIERCSLRKDLIVSLRAMCSVSRFSQYSAVILSLLMTCFILISHWLACVFIVIGRYQVGAGHEGWMDQLAIQNKLDNKTLISHLES